MSSFLTKVIKNSLMKKSTLSSLNYINVRSSSLWEPDYLIMAKNGPPIYDLINFEIKGYDFVILEKYQQLIHKIANKMGFSVSNSWATPCQDLRVVRYKPQSSVVENEYLLHLYERNVQISYPEGYKVALLIDLAVTSCPPGVKLSVHKHLPEMDKIRYVPQLEVIELEGQLEELRKKK